MAGVSKRKMPPWIADLLIEDLNRVSLNPPSNSTHQPARRFRLRINAP